MVALEKSLESSLDSKEIQPVHPKGNQSWIFIERTNAEAEAPILWPPDSKSRFIGKDSDAEKDWRQEESSTTEGRSVQIAALAVDTTSLNTFALSVSSLLLLISADKLLYETAIIVETVL